MKPARRVMKTLSVIFIAAGTLLLLYVAGTFYLSAQETTVFEEAVQSRPPLANLPPALQPAADPVPTSIPKTAVDMPVMEEAAVEAPLLPESPVNELSADTETAVEEQIGSEDGRPLRIIIPALNIDAPVVTAGLQTLQDGDRQYQQWTVPNSYAAGWHENSPKLGEVGNIVLNGHNNIYGAIFGELRELAVGEQIVLVGANNVTVYRVAHHELLKEEGLPLRERLQNANWIAPTTDQRLTLVTCWPNTTNSHRLIVVALPEKET